MYVGPKVFVFTHYFVNIRLVSWVERGRMHTAILRPGLAGPLPLGLPRKSDKHTYTGCY
jgi:hypothetical protein